MKPRRGPKPNSQKKMQDEVVHLEDLIPRREIKGGAKKLRFGEAPDREASKKPER